MDNCITFYNMNNLFKMRIEGPAHRQSYINRQYSYFRIDNVLKAEDLTVYIGSLKDPLSRMGDFNLVHKKYKVTRDAVYCKDKYKVARWEFLIKGLESNNTQLYFDGNIWAYYMLYKHLIEAILRYKINDKGVVMLHAASVSGASGALVFSASPGVGKTTLMLSLLRAGRAFVADEYTAMCGNSVYAYPTPLRIHDYNIRLSPFIRDNLSAGDRLQICLRSWINRLSLGYGVITYEMDIRNFFPGVNIKNKCPLDKLIVLTSTNDRELKVESISKEMMAEKLIIINRFETKRFAEYIDAYYYANPDKKSEGFWEKMKSNIYSVLENGKFFEIYIPVKNSCETYSSLISIIESL